MSAKKHSHINDGNDESQQVKIRFRLDAFNVPEFVRDASSEVPVKASLVFELKKTDPSTIEDGKTDPPSNKGGFPLNAKIVDNELIIYGRAVKSKSNPETFEVIADGNEIIIASGKTGSDGDKGKGKD